MAVVVAEIASGITACYKAEVTMLHSIYGQHRRSPFPRPGAHGWSYHTQPFYGPLSGTTCVSWCQKKSSSGFYDAREDNRGRNTDNLAGHHSIRTNQRPTSVIPPFLHRMPFIPQPSHFILAWDGHQICWLAYPVMWFTAYSSHGRNLCHFPPPPGETS